MKKYLTKNNKKYFLVAVILLAILGSCNGEAPSFWNLPLGEVKVWAAVIWIVIFRALS